jgi:digeranylgeranylglycerophospholipid reductase
MKKTAILGISLPMPLSCLKSSTGRLRIIVATGDNCIAKRLHVWTDTFTAFARVASALGRFKTDLAFLWLNNDYAINSFCYLVPNSEKEASLCMIVNGITHAELDYYWKRFLIKEDIRYEITEIRDAEHCCGFVEPLHKNGIYFIGNSGGFTDDFIGTGAYNAILSGIYAARAVMDGKDYEVLCKPVYKNVKKLHEFRKTVNVLENRDYDRLLFLLGAPGIKQYIYKNPFFKVSRHAFIAKAMRITFSRL